MATIQLGAAIQRGLAAGKPASGDAAKAGQLYFETDTGTLWHDDGSTWEEVGADSSGLAAHLADTTDAHDASAVSFAPTGTIAATTAQAAIGEVASEAASALATEAGTRASDDSTLAAAITAHTGDTTDAHDASAISFTPAGTIAATTVQAAIEEVASEAGGGGGHVIQDDGTPLTARANLNFIPGASGVTVTDNSGDDSTDVNFSALTGGGGGLTVEELDGTPTGTPTTLQFPNGTLTDLGGGVYKYTPTPGAASVLTTTGDILYVGPSITPGADVALGKTTTASVASGTGGTNSGNLVDNNSATYWSTVGLGGSPQHATVDLGSEIEVTGFAIMQYGSGYEAATIKVQGSHDGTTFADIPGSAVSPTNSGSLQSFTFTGPVTYRHYRLHVLTDNGTPGAGTGLKQFSLYASGALVLERLPIGTAGQVLTATAVGGDVLPRWA